MVACLVAGREAAEQFPTLLRYLQLGLIDASVETLRVVMQGESLATLQTGTAVILQDRPLTWPLSRWSRQAFIAGVHRKLEVMQRGSPAVIHGVAPSSAEYAVKIADDTASELVLTVYSYSQTRDPAPMRWLQRASAVLTPSRRLRDAIPTSVISNKPVEVVPVGISVSPAPAAFRSPDRAPVIVYSGPLTEESSVDCLLRAAKQVISRVPNLLLFIIGKGHAEDQLRRMSESLEINDAVTFTGKIDDWRSVLDAADIFCVPSAPPHWREEPLAALAAGVCVICAEGNLCDELIDGRTALTFARDDDAALAQRITRLLADPAAARDLAAAGQAYLRTNNTPARMVAEHLKVYKQLTNRHQVLAFPAARSS